MRALIEREKALNMFFRDGTGYKKVAKELGIPVDTVKAWVRRYRIDHGEPESGESKRIKVIKEYKSRDTTPEKSDRERIEKLEMEVELLRTFLYEKERRSIKP